MHNAFADPIYGRRREFRREIVLSGKVRLPLGNTGSAALMANGNIENLSAEGVRVHIHSLHKEHVPVLEHEARHHCHVSCQLPGTDSPSFFSGDIAWMEVFATDPKPSARLGLRLSATEPEERERLTQFLKRYDAETGG